MPVDETALTTVFEAALLLEGEARVAFIQAACGTDVELERRVEALLAVAEKPALLDRPLGQAIAELLEDGDEVQQLIGTDLGRYRIESLLGTGGMGEVYAAFDTDLKRRVAIKVLPADLAVDPDRLARFQREAETLASLNHPSIAVIHGIERSGSVTGLVMELVDGPTLADLISSGPTSIDDALSIARQVAEALEAAHDQGIVHRDLKPANIKIRPDGTVKVLDFGLAKVTTPTASKAAGTSSAITTPVITHAGIILGTAAYMSPEQARGREADKRSDVWAYGCVLYEMLTRRRAFGPAARELDNPDGGVAETLAAVLRGEPDWRAIPSNVPAGVVTLIKACLTKDQRARPSGMAGALFALNHASAFSSGAGTRERASLRARWRTVATGAGAAVAGAAVMFVAGRGAVPPTNAPVTRVDIALPSDAPLTGQGVALSPDGRTLVVPAGNRLMLRRLDRAELTTLDRTEGATLPFFSPDGEWIGFIADGMLRRVKVDGSTVLTIAPVPITAPTATWSPDGTILFGSVGTGLYRVSAAGGTPAQLTQPRRDAGEVGHRTPQWLPDGRVLFWIEQEGEGRAAILDVGTGRWEVLPGVLGRSWRYVESGHLLFVADRTLFAARYRPGDRSVQAAVPIASDVDPSFDVTRNGTIAFFSTGARQADTSVTGRIALLDRAGTASALGGPEVVTIQGATTGGLAFSPDGTRIAASLNAGQGGDLWIYELARRARVRLTDVAVTTSPIWAPDGRRVLFNWTRNPPGLYDIESGVGGVWRLMLKRDTAPQIPYAWNRDGSLVFGVRDSRTGYDVWLRRADGTTAPLLNTAAQERNARVSPDGRWLAFETDASTQPEVYVRPLTDAGRTELVSDGGGSDPRWAGNRELIYRRSTDVMAVPVSPNGDRLTFGASHRLFAIDDYPSRYDVSPDGTRFVVLRRDSSTVGAASGTVHLILNLFDEREQ